MKAYTVIGIYTEPFGQRFATSVEAHSAREAERLAAEEADEGLIIAGVVEGQHGMADTYTDGVSGAREDRQALIEHLRRARTEICAASDEEIDTATAREVIKVLLELDALIVRLDPDPLRAPHD